MEKKEPTPLLFTAERNKVDDDVKQLRAFLGCTLHADSPVSCFRKEVTPLEIIRSFHLDDDGGEKKEFVTEMDCDYKVEICGGTEHGVVEALLNCGGWRPLTHVPPGTKSDVGRAWHGCLNSRTMCGAFRWFVKDWVKEPAWLCKIATARLFNTATMHVRPASFGTRSSFVAIFTTTKACEMPCKCRCSCLAMPGDTINWRFDDLSPTAIGYNTATQECDLT